MKHTMPVKIDTQKKFFNLLIFFWQIIDDDESGDAAVPVIFEDRDSSEEEESENEAMETDDHDRDAGDEAFGGLSDLEGSDGMSE